eukprot:CAMPEP_0182422338 /NCGR_PEP_ID=MMETSP1167-20130531/7992_1 /TAXON_ID=2988 /ORGANISM="Mallomonas Sp, Strain CCMP3275" /LENGTH=471 /DNA_ID=CAMNT_0024600309 /DNA_START=223 /DNA_END=1638 /DNA_ORIENTATION=+
MKKIKISADKQIADNNRRISEYEKSISSCERQRTETCKEWGIEGRSNALLRYELLTLTQKLPSLFDEIETFIRTEAFKSAVDYFIIFIRFLFSNESRGNETERDVKDVIDNDIEYLPRIRAILRGDRLRGSDSPRLAPAVAAAAAAPAGDGTNTSPNGSDAVNWEMVDLPVEVEGGTGTGTEGGDWSHSSATGPLSLSLEENEEEATVDWNLSMPVDLNYEGFEAAEISWDVETEMETESGGMGSAVQVGEGSGVDIAWDSTDSFPVESKESAALSDAGLSVVSAAELQTSPCMTTFSLLSEADFRDRLTDDLDELRAFLSQRLQETMSGEHLQLASIAVGTLGSSALSAGGVLSKSVEEIKSFLNALKIVEDRLNCPRLRQLTLLKERKGYLDRAVKSIVMHTDKAEKLQLLLSEATLRRSESMSTVAEIGPRVNTLISSIKELKEQIEVALKQLLQCKAVHIIGDLNSL